MRGIPRSVGSAGSIEVAELRCAGTAAGPVLAGMIRSIRICAAVRLRTSQDVVLVRRVAKSFDRLALLGQRSGSSKRVANARHFERVAVQIGEALRDTRTLSVVPRALADAVARVDGRLTARPAGAEVSMPRAIPCPGGLGELLAVLVGPGDAAEIRAFTPAHARNEEAHRLRRRFLGGRLPHHH